MQNADEKKEIIKMWCIAHFTAVCYNKLQPKKTMRVYLREFQKRFYEVRCFDINEWTPKTAEVRPDRGKFLNSTWEVVCNGKAYWVTIGVGNYIITIVQRNSSGKDLCIRGGNYYNFVEDVNRRLMDDDLALLGVKL